MTHKALAFPASSASQTCGVVSLAPVKQPLVTGHLEQFAGSGARTSRTLRSHGAADDDRSAGRRAAAGRFDAGGRAG